MRPLACLDGDLKSGVSVAGLILIMGLIPVVFFKQSVSFKYFYLICNNLFVFRAFSTPVYIIKPDNIIFPQVWA